MENTKDKYKKMCEAANKKICLTDFLEKNYDLLDYEEEFPNLFKKSGR